jgi:5-bromo-4-chloroindolyl phosphate hydrolysis protein
MPVKYRQSHVHSSTSYNAWLLYLYSFPYLFTIITKLIKGEFINLVLVSAIFIGVLISALWMSVGIKNKSYYLARKYPKSTPFPMMFLSSLVLGASSLCAAWLVGGYNLFAGLGFGAAAMVGCWLWYGLDPVKSKHISFSEITDADAALDILQNSETLIINIEKSSLNIENAEMSQRLVKITRVARDVLKILYENPEKIRKARRFLNTYLTGAESVVERFAVTHKKNENLQLEENFREVLENIEIVFVEQYDKLISSDAFDLDVDIEVLKTLLEKQGIN